jgi:hypothetical protein
MSTYPIKFDQEDRWGVYQSNSCSMFSPTFPEWLPAFLFACHYSPRNRSELFSLDYSDEAQERLSLDLEIWLDEILPKNKPHCRLPDRALPAAWLDELEPLDTEIDLADCPRSKQARCNHIYADECCGGGAGHPCDCEECHPRHTYDYDQLISDLEANTPQTVSLVMGAFAEWQLARKLPAKVPA